MTGRSGQNIVNVLLVTHYYASHRGGIEIVAEGLAQRLVRHGPLRITWVASDTTPPPETVRQGLHCVPMRSTNIIEDRLNIPFPLWSPGSLARLWSLIGQADIVHLHDFLYFGNVCAFLFAKLRRKLVLVTQHVGHVPYRSVLRRWLIQAGNAVLGRLILGKADQTVFISEVVQRFFEQRVRFRRPPRFIPNPVDTSVFSGEGAAGRVEARRKLGLPQNGWVFLFVGRFVEKKGLHILRQLVQHFVEATWAFAGWGLIDPDRWNLPNVRLFRGLSGHELRPLYQAADLLVLPSIGEGLPLVIQEAMACGTPVLVSEETAQADSAATPLMFYEKVHEHTRETDTVRLWQERIAALIQSPSLLTKQRARVEVFAQTHWAWEPCLTAYVDLIEELAQRGH